MSNVQEPTGSGFDSQIVSFQEVMDTLSHGEIQEEHGVLPWGSNYAYLVSMSDEARSLLAVYKPQRGERPLWDFPAGTLCYREVAAFKVSEALGWQLVPPTVLRSGPYGLGSIQFFIHHDPEVTYFTPFPEEAWPQLQYFVVFDYLINNADRKGGHCLLDAEGHLWGIDHGVTFHFQPKLRTVIWDFAGQPVPGPIIEDLGVFCDTLNASEPEGKGFLQGLLSEQEVMAFRRRLDTILETRVFPQPGPGPNYPWPPV
ncbi:MAG: SCO1664 family protein [Anaerolineae bacterium]|nr:SCO1664 family protein [Anaerolineae bacterium]